MNTTYDSFTVGGRLGADVPLSESFSFYPHASLSIGGESWDETSAGYENRPSDTSFSGALFAPLLVHPASHVFFGLGPYVNHDFSRTLDAGTSIRATRVGATFLVGGVAMTAPDPDALRARSSRRAQSALGEAQGGAGLSPRDHQAPSR
ncbi:MAG: hypothetical protein ACREJ3_19285 [Polyangiaceae bacterium]